MQPANTALVNTLLIAIVSGLVGWAFQDLRRRVSILEFKMSCLVTGMFYLVTSNPTVPTEVKRALEEAMKGK